MRTATAIACTLALMAAPLVGCIGSSDDGADQLDTNEAPGSDDGEQGSTPADDGSSVGSNELDTFATNGSFDAELYRVGLPGEVTGDEPAITFDAPADAAQIVVEFRWSGTQGTFDLELFAPTFCEDSAAEVDPLVDGFACSIAYFATEEDGGAYQAEGSDTPVEGNELRLVLEAEEIVESSCEESSCEWRAYAFAEAAVDVSFEMHVTVAHDQPLPADYTALEG